MRLIAELRHDHKLSDLLLVAGLLRSRFYYQCQAAQCADKQSAMEARIRTVYDEHKWRYGTRRIRGGRTKTWTTMRKSVSLPASVQHRDTKMRSVIIVCVLYVRLKNWGWCSKPLLQCMTAESVFRHKTPIRHVWSIHCFLPLREGLLLHPMAIWPPADTLTPAQADQFVRAPSTGWPTPST